MYLGMSDICSGQTGLYCVYVQVLKVHILFNACHGLILSTSQQ